MLKPRMSFRSILTMLLLSLAILFIIAGVVRRVSAQDVEATDVPGNMDPVQIPSDPAQPIVVEDGGTLVINQTDETPAVPIEAPSNNLFVGIGAVLFGIAAIIFAVHKGSSADQSATLELERLQANRGAVQFYEAMFEQQQETTRQLIGVATMLIKTIAPLTPIKADDALGGLLDDIQTPGDPPVMG